VDPKEWATKLDEEIAKQTGKPGKYILSVSLPVVSLDVDAFGDTEEADAEHIVAQALLKTGALQAFAKSDLAQGKVPNTAMGRKFANSYSPYGPWWVMARTKAFTIPEEDGTTHFSPYSYDTHVPLAFYGAPFQPGVYREHSEPIDLAVTISSLLGITKPAAATGRVLTETLKPQPKSLNPSSAEGHARNGVVK
jgi:hypothetical protein